MQFRWKELSLCPWRWDSILVGLLPSLLPCFWAPSMYNTIFRQRGLNALRTIISMYCLKMMFLIVYGIREVCEDQDLAYHYYHITLWGVETANIYLIEGLDTHNELAKQQEEPAKGLISIPLLDRNEEHRIWIRSNLNQVIKNQLTLFL